jgi:uncharacterized protein (DUF4415 family)
MHMRTKKAPISAEWIDPDDAPRLTKQMLDQAEFFDGNRFVQRGRGRPKLASPKEQINIRLDADVLERLRANGPGWQTKINEILRVSLGLPDAT